MASSIGNILKSPRGCVEVPTIGKQATADNSGGGGGGAGPDEYHGHRLFYGKDVSADAVDLHFRSSFSRLDYGNVQFVKSVPADRIDATLRDAVTVPTCGSNCARGLLVAISALIPVFGWAAICAKAKYVKNDQVSLAKGCDGAVYVLSRGCHVHTTFCREVHDFKTTDDHIVMAPVNLIRVLPGHYGIADNNGVPVVLEPGRHFINDPLFRWIKAVPFTQGTVKHNTVNIITVPGGQLGLVTCLGVGHILEPGRHLIENNNVVFNGFVSATSESVTVLAKHRIMVPEGRIGLAWDGGDAQLLTSDRVYYIDNNLFK
jgi:hypothetical protein